MGRIETIKRIGFPEEECPKCHSDSENCDLCHGTGRFKQRLRKDWQQPKLLPGQRLVVYLDFDEWSTGCIEDADGKLVEELNFPFATDFATASHFQNLGFSVEQ